MFFCICNATTARYIWWRHHWWLQCWQWRYDIESFCHRELMEDDSPGVQVFNLILIYSHFFFTLSTMFYLISVYCFRQSLQKLYTGEPFIMCKQIQFYMNKDQNSSILIFIQQPLSPISRWQKKNFSENMAPIQVFHILSQYWKVERREVSIY